RKSGDLPIEPLYTQEDAIEAMDYFYPIPYHKPREILPDVELNFFDAGHMLGSAIVSLQIQDRDTNREIRLVFSGDLGRKNLPIIRDPQTIDHADILIMESTYGDRLHPPAPETDKELAEIVNRTYQRGGALVIPSFAVGRTQQIVYVFQQLVAEGRIPKLPIYVDSPLAVNVTEAFRSHPEVYDKEIQDYMYTYRDDDPFGFDQLHYTRSVEESKQLNTKEDPFVVISASGMCEAGRILHHLRNRVGDPRNTILIVGWQAQETLGRRLLEGRKTVRIFGEDHNVRAEVLKANGLSGHADADELVAWTQAISKKPRQTFLVHGEPDPAKALKKRLQEEVGLEEVIVPELHQSVRL
ncbi:MAG: MBL fold metallo-hydrolase, partial [Anaerolineae bacterium]|nr:MBL fold metallo-hydrolase [Anaerolineae bacterium]